VYTISDQPGIPDKKKRIVKTEVLTQESHLMIEDLLWNHGEICAIVQKCKNDADNIIDELIEINKILPVGDIPEKFKQEKN
jgi:hypothetical protein